ncbi:hypothetical protein HGRIS_001117 [Hohenbuehelia grisea]|uniref:Uncharacterized protein n=1 Tax=Hohenbuehelia grisea TaxID=104357 RepID=A0ABR3JPC2_9AGAR
MFRLPPGSDPGTFLLGRPGLYMRERDVVAAVLFFEGNDIHTGFAPSVEES